MRSTIAVAGRADADLVWERYALPQRWSEWSPQIRSVRASATRLVAGMTGTVHGPVGVRVPFVVERVDESARSWGWRVRVAPFTLQLTHEVIERPEGCVTTLCVDGPAPLVLGYLPLARLALGRLVR